MPRRGRMRGRRCGSCRREGGCSALLKESCRFPGREPGRLGRTSASSADPSLALPFAHEPTLLLLFLDELGFGGGEEGAVGVGLCGGADVAFGEGVGWG